MENELDKYLDMAFSGLEGYLYSPVKKPDVWEQKYFEYPKEQSLISDWVKTNALDSSADVYISPVLYNKPHAIKANFKVSQVVWVEWDGERFIEFPGLPEPTAIVQTSSETHYHCYWSVEPVNKDTLEDINRRLTFYLQADSSGWDCTQLLRPPGTFNRKYGLHRPVVLSSFQEKKHLLPVFDKAPKIEKSFHEAVFEENILPLGQVLKGKNLPADLVTQLKLGTAVEPNRSTFLASLANRLAENSFSHLEIVSAIYEVDKRVKKFTGRSDQLLRLNQLADYALHKHIADEQLTIYSPRQIIDFAEELEWILMGMLHSTGQMIISSAPGVGKTQLALQLAFHLLTNQTFLGVGSTGSQKHCILFMSLEMDIRSLRYIFGRQMQEWNSEPDGFHIIDESASLNRYEELVKKIQPTVIIIDSLTEILETTDRNPSDVAVETMRWCKRIRLTYGCAIILIHHNRKATEGNKKPKTLSDLAGSYHFGRVTDTVIQLWQDHKGLELSTVKSRFGQRQEFLLLRNENLWFRRKDDISNQPQPVQSDSPGVTQFNASFGGYGNELDKPPTGEIPTRTSDND